MAKRRRRKVEANLRRGGTRNHRFKDNRYLAFLVVPLGLIILFGLTASPSGSTNSDYRLGDYTDFIVTGDLLTDEAATLSILVPSSVPDGLRLAGIVRSYAFEGTLYLVYASAPLTSGTFSLQGVLRSGSIVVIEQPATPRTNEQREAFVKYSIEEAGGMVERVEINGYLGLVGSGEIPQIRWWQGGLELFVLGHLTGAELLTIAESVQLS
ncbi:MAG: hypothetical protein ACE5JE_00485 [Thermoplasmata archaeon]